MPFNELVDGYLTRLEPVIKTIEVFKCSKNLDGDALCLVVVFVKHYFAHRIISYTLSQ